MTLIAIKKGLDIPMSGSIQRENIFDIDSERQAIDFRDFSHLRLRPTVCENDTIAQHAIIAEEKDKDKRIFRSPFAGVVKTITYFDKRRLDKIVIERAHDTTPYSFSNSWDDVFASSIFQYIRMRPFGVPPVKNRKPQRIFINAVSSAPFEPSTELQIQGNEELFQKGIDYLSNFSKVEVIHKQGSPCRAFSEVKNATPHQAIGSYPISNPSVHIEQLWQIQSTEDTIWTCDTFNTIMIGHLQKGESPLKKIIAIAGSGVKEEHRGYYKVPPGIPLRELLQDKLIAEDAVIIDGNPLTGHLTTLDGFLSQNSYAISVLIPDNSRMPLHFFRIKAGAFTQSPSYLNNKLAIVSNRYHGESRAFVLSDIYDKFMPLQIPTAQLIRAVLAKDFDKAIELGLLEVVAEDFALPSFVCPSKIDMMGIIQDAIYQIYSDYLHP